MKKKINHYFIYLFVYFLFSNNAHAYLDPGTGSIILQALVVFFASVAAFFSFYWKKIKSFVTKIFLKNQKK